MGSKVDSFENAILDHALGTTESTFVAQCYVGLFTVAPTDSTSGTEVSGGSYARQAINFAAASGGSATQSGVVTFPQATGSWGTVVAWGIFDASSAGNLRYWGDVTPNKAVDSGDTASFADGEIVVTED